MAVSIAEYLGQRTGIDNPTITPVARGGKPMCPFMNLPCSKVPKGYKPVCSVRKRNGSLWIVCKDRLCSTNKRAPLTEHQKGILFSVGRYIFSEDIGRDNLLIKREEPMPVIERSSYKADYIMLLHDYGRELRGPRNVVLEMQGGGETSNTGKITKHVSAWERKRIRTNSFLSEIVQSASTIETNAWRRQQEQFLVKGNIAQQTGGGIVFCVGAPLYDYLWQRVQDANLRDLREHNWSLCLICFDEDRDALEEPGPIPLRIVPERVLFTNYITFVQTLINQGAPNPNMFRGNFETLDGDAIEIG